MITNIDNLNINFEVYGSGKDVLIFHGWKDNLTSWRNCAQIISEKGFRVFIIDFPGFGESQIPSKPWGVKEYAKLIYKLMNDFEIKKAVLIGHSMGGKIACYFTASYPEKAEELILIASSGLEIKHLSTKIKIYIVRIAKSIATISGLKNSPMLDKLKNRFGSPDYKASGPLRSTFLKVVNFNIKKYLDKIKCKTLIIWGDKDKELPIDNSLLFKKSIRNSSIRIVWDSSHFPQLDNYKTLSGIIVDFINE